MSASFATLCITGVFDTLTWTLKSTCFVVDDEEKNDPEEDPATYFHVSEEDIIILDPPADSDPEADESVRVVFDSDF